MKFAEPTKLYRKSGIWGTLPSGVRKTPTLPLGSETAAIWKH